MKLFDYTINKDIPLHDDQNEVVDYMLKHPFCINADQTGLCTWENIFIINSFNAYFSKR